MGTRAGAPESCPPRAMAPAAPALLVCASAAEGRALTSQPANQPLGPGHSGQLPVQGEVAMQRVPAAAAAAGRAGARRALVLSLAPPPVRRARAVVAPQPPAPGAHWAHGRGGDRPPAARAPLYVHLHHHSPFFSLHLLFLLLLLGLEARVVAAPRLPRARRERRRWGGRGSGRGVPRGRLPDALHLDLQAPLLAEAARAGEAGARGPPARHQPARARRSGRRRPLRVPGLLRLHAARVHHRGHWRPARRRPVPRSALSAAGAMFLSSRGPPPPALRPRAPQSPASLARPLGPPPPALPRLASPRPAAAARCRGRREAAAPAAGALGERRLGPCPECSRSPGAPVPSGGKGFRSWHCVRDPERVLGSLLAASRFCLGWPRARERGKPLYATAWASETQPEPLCSRSKNLSSVWKLPANSQQSPSADFLGLGRAHPPAPSLLRFGGFPDSLVGSSVHALRGPRGFGRGALGSLTLRRARPPPSHHRTVCESRNPASGSRSRALFPLSRARPARRSAVVSNLTHPKGSLLSFPFCF